MYLWHGDIQHTRSGTLYAKSFIISSPNGQKRRKGYTEETPTLLSTLTLIWIILTKFQHFSTPDIDIRNVLLSVVYMFKHLAGLAWWRKQRFTYKLKLFFVFLSRFERWWYVESCDRTGSRFPVKYCPSSRPNQLNIFCDKWRHHIFVIFSN